MPERYFARQISIFSRDEPGRLASVARALESEGINMLAFSLAEASDFGIIRALVDRPEEAHERLCGMGFMVTYTDVIAVSMRDEPGGLSEIATVLGDEGINIDYAYAYSGKGGAVLVLRVSDTASAVRALRDSGKTLLERAYFER